MTVDMEQPTEYLAGRNGRCERNGCPRYGDRLVWMGHYKLAELMCHRCLAHLMRVCVGSGLILRSRPIRRDDEEQEHAVA
jgi:hypothetical protein